MEVPDQESQTTSQQRLGLQAGDRALTKNNHGGFFSTLLFVPKRSQEVRNP